MSLQARLLRITILIPTTATVWCGAWLLLSDRWPPFGTTPVVCIAVWAYDFFVVRRDEGFEPED